MSGDVYITVNKQSATAGCDENSVSLTADHSGLVKYKNGADGNYETVKGILRKLVDKAKPEVAKRFAGRASDEGANTPCT